MKYIRYIDQYVDIFDNPIAVVDPDHKAQKKVRDFALAEGKAAGISFTAIKWDFALIENATFAQGLAVFANGIPYGEREKDGPELRATPSDQEKAAHAVRAFQKHPEGHVLIEEETLTWLKELVKDHGPSVWRGTIPTLILDRLNDELTPEEVVEIHKAEAVAEASNGAVPNITALGPAAESLLATSTLKNSETVEALPEG